MKYTLDVPFVFPAIDATIFNYPKWRHLIPEEPSEDDFNSAWVQEFEYPYSDCHVEYGEQSFYGNSLGSGHTIHTPKGVIFHGGLCDYIDDPVLSEDETFYYTGAGCGWASDILGQRYLKIDPKSLMPVDWDSWRNKLIICRYLIHKSHP